MTLTRTEIRMIADEMAKAMQRQYNILHEELLTTEELAKMLKVSEGYVRHHANDWPNIRVGGNVRYPKSKVLESILI